MKFILTAAICLSLLIFGVAAQAETKLEKAERVFDLAMSPETLGDMGARTGRLIADQIDAGLRAKDRKLSERDRGQLIVRFATSFVGLMGELKPEIVKIYADEMSERELYLMIEINSDPEMAALMTKMPIVMERMLPIIQAPATALGRDVIRNMQGDGLLSDL